MIKNIKELYNIQKNIWKDENEKYFGITPLNEWDDLNLVKEHLEKCSDKFWNNGTNELKKLFEKGKCKNIDKLLNGSYELIFDSENGCICLFGTFIYDELDKISGKNKEKTKRAPLAYLPYPNDLCWFMGNSEYVLRIFAIPNYGLISRNGNICKYQKAWTYDILKDEFETNININPYEDLTNINKKFLEACYKHEINDLDSFKEALKTIPEFERNSIVNFKFGHVDEIFKLISTSKRFANPLMRVSIPINVIKMFTALRSSEEDQDDGSFSNLVLNSNKLFALENSRTAIYKSTYNISFSFTDSNKVFDAFKTSTNKSAGRSRLLLDEAIVKDGMIWNLAKDINNENDTNNEKYYNMFELIINNDLQIENNLSVLSCSRFSSSNDAKRLMMTAKLRAQAIPTEGEIDEFTHETPARICFGDFKGFNFGDAIIVSRSFARKMKTFYDKKIKFNSLEDFLYINRKFKVGDKIELKDLFNITKSTMYNNYRNIIITAINNTSFSIHAECPLSVGDKITNLHGSKGIVSMILEDDQMPFLKNNIIDKENNILMEKGPFEIIVSGLSVFRRKTSGQIFEAWALATHHDDVNNIVDAVNKYKDDLIDFSNQSIVSWNGEEYIKPIGINMIIRLDHNAVTKQVFSYIKTNTARMLKFGEMELLNLASRGMYSILNEIDIRSVSKHYNSIKEIKEMQENGNISYSPADNLKFLNILKNIGFDFNLIQRINIDDEDKNNIFYEQLKELLNDDQIDLFYEQEDDKNGN